MRGWSCCYSSRLSCNCCSSYLYLWTTCFVNIAAAAVAAAAAIAAAAAAAVIAATAETRSLMTAFINVFCVLQYDNIDSEHKAIFECIFNCSKDPSNAGLITKLYKTTEDHFKDEEVPWCVSLLYRAIQCL